MKLKTLIKKLQKFEEKYGNLDVMLDPHSLSKDYFVCDLKKIDIQENIYMEEPDRIIDVIRLSSSFPKDYDK